MVKSERFGHHLIYHFTIPLKTTFLNEKTKES